MRKGANAKGRGLLLISIIAISFSLRAPITSIGPLAGLIHTELGVANSFIGFITTLPLLAFAVGSPFISKISLRFGQGNTMLGGLIAIVAGGLLRSYAGIFGLLVGTALIGMGISAANVLIPSIVKLRFPEKIGLVTGIYLTSMGIFASLGAGASYPIAMAGFGWKFASSIWVGVALVAAFIWVPQHRLGSRSPSDDLQGDCVYEENPCHPDPEAERKTIWKSSLAWYITLFMGFQSINFYSLTAWLPSILQGNGMTPEWAGYMAFWYQLVGLPFSFITPILAARVKNQRTIVLCGCSSYIIGLVMLMAFHSKIAVILGLFFLANGGTASFSWAMAMISLKAKDSREAVKLSGMCQTIGYLLAAIGPTLCGAIYDSTGVWMIVLWLFLGITVVMLITGIMASRREKLFN